jgi:hypothetical protein
VITGTLARTQGYGKAQLKACLSDALIYLAATKTGLPVLTENRADFDLIQQLAPEGKVVWFDRLASIRTDNSRLTLDRRA